MASCVAASLAESVWQYEGLAKGVWDWVANAPGVDHRKSKFTFGLVVFSCMSVGRVFNNGRGGKFGRIGFVIKLLDVLLCGPLIWQGGGQRSPELVVVPHRWRRGWLWGW
jgi:hypothetical protein